MKKYLSPICEFNAFEAEDVITTSTFSLFNWFQKGNLDDGSNVDSIDW